MLLNPKLECSAHWFALNLVRKECELWSLVMSIDGGILGRGDFFLGGTLVLGILALFSADDSYFQRKYLWFALPCINTAQ